MNDDTIIRKIQHGIMGNDPVHLRKTLWRMANGDKTKAYHIIRETAPHYGIDPSAIEDFHIDCALAELNDGLEVEWDTDSATDVIEV
jgi:hypothetical protein